MDARNGRVANANFAEYLQIHYVQGTGELAVVCGAVLGAGLGFLWFNAPPAAIFMGDTGSLALGGMLGSVAVATKQHAVLAVPLIAAWAVVRGADVRELIRAAALATGAALAMLAPFMSWNAGAFIRDTIVFVAGSGPDAYPINGFGLSAFLLSNGVIHGARDAFPFAAVEVVVGVAIWTIGWLRIRARARLADVLLFAGLAMLLVLYVSRYFHDSHLLLGAELVLAGLVARMRAPAPLPAASRAAAVR